MLIGYARVSTEEQNLDLQTDALKKAGCEKVFADKISGVKSERKGLNAALEMLRPGDVLMVWRLDRLGRSLKHLIELVGELEQKNIGFCSLTENIDSTTPGGKLVFHLFGALAEFERNLIRERTKAGLAAARARGRKSGRKNVMDEKKIRQAQALMTDPNNTITDICKTLGIGRTSFYKYVKTQKKP
ncbi:MAG: Resolvase/integrase [Stygiobacter sp.]|nr:MAG: Resolvase/integrase [Stygiobacter sp.]